MKENRQKEIPIKKTDVKKTVVNYLLITVASAVYSVAVSLFLDPNSLAPGGVTGIAIILNRLIPVETGTLILLINIPILILGAWKFGLRFSLSTIYCTVVISLFTNLLSGVKTATADPLLAARAAAWRRWGSDGCLKREPPPGARISSSNSFGARCLI